VQPAPGAQPEQALLPVARDEPEELPRAAGLPPAEGPRRAEPVWSVLGPEAALDVPVLLPGAVSVASVELVLLPAAVSDAPVLPREARAALAVVQPSAALPWALLSSCHRDPVRVAPAR
jgi:hypothetical protein